MVRMVVYGFMGALLGAFLGLVFLAWSDGTHAVEILWGGLLGLIAGLCIAIYMNKHKILDQSFVTDKDIHNFLMSEADAQRSLSLSFPFGVGKPREDVAWRYRALPTPIARWLTSISRSFLEKGKRRID